MGPALRALRFCETSCSFAASYGAALARAGAAAVRERWARVLRVGAYSGVKNGDGIGRGNQVTWGTG